MGITTEAHTLVAYNMAGSKLPKQIAIGDGGTAFSGNQTALDSEFDRNLINTSDLQVSGEVTFIADWSPLEVSGLVLKEFGTMSTGSDMFNREVLAGSIVFDGEQELQVQQTFQFYS